MPTVVGVAHLFLLIDEHHQMSTFLGDEQKRMSTFSEMSTFKSVAFVNIKRAVIFLSWWIHQLRKNAEKKNCDYQSNDVASIRWCSSISCYYFIFALSTTLISTKLNICRKDWIVDIICTLSGHELKPNCFPQNKTQTRQNCSPCKYDKYCFRTRCQICLAPLSFNILLILFASSYKDILEKEKKGSDVAFLFVTLYSTTLNIFAKYLKFGLFFSNQTSVCRKWLSQEKTQMSK